MEQKENLINKLTSFLESKFPKREQSRWIFFGRSIEFHLRETFKRSLMAAIWF